MATETETEIETPQASEVTLSFNAINDTAAPASAPAGPHPSPSTQQTTPSAEPPAATREDNADPGGTKGDAPVMSKDDAPVNKEDSPLSKDDAPISKDDAPVNKEDSPVNKDDAPVMSKDDAPDAPVMKSDTPTPSRDPVTLPGSGDAAAPVAPAAGADDRTPGRTEKVLPVPHVPHPHSFHGPANPPAKSNASGPLPPLTLNHVAIVAASQNKLPLDKLRAFVTRMGRHTQSSAGKLGRWYKGDNYVDKDSYSWRNMELFADYQKQMYTASGTVKASCKK